MKGLYFEFLTPTLNIVLFIYIFLIIIGLISLMKIFSNLEKSPVIALIPIYNLWTLLKLVNLKGWYSLIPIYNLFALLYSFFLLGEKYNKGILFKVGLVVMSPIFLLILAFSPSKEKKILPDLMTPDPSLGGKVDLMAKDPVLSTPIKEINKKESKIKEMPSLEMQLKSNNKEKEIMSPKSEEPKQQNVLDAFNMPLKQEEKIETLTFDDETKYSNMQKTQKICLECGSPNDILNKFCVGCGYNFEKK